MPGLLRVAERLSEDVSIGGRASLDRAYVSHLPSGWSARPQNL